MPVMDGLEATRILRADETGKFGPQLSSIPVVVLTASAVLGDEERCRGAGMSGYLRKPVSREMLEKEVKRWTSGRP